MRHEPPFPYSAIVDRPDWRWPNGKQLALWVVVNVEHFALDQRLPGGEGNIPDVLAWSIRDYGARVGFWRLAEVLGRHGVRASVALNADVCDAYPRIVEEIALRGWECLGHNLTNTRRLSRMDPAEEAETIRCSLERIEDAVGLRPQGWLSSGLQETWQTLELLVKEGVGYVADWVNDDQPYAMDVGGRELISVPYTHEIHDIAAFVEHHRTPEEFASLVRRQFEVLHEEAATSARVMCVALHPYLIGHPYRIRALDAALKQIAAHGDVWLATGGEIAAAYRDVLRSL